MNVDEFGKLLDIYQDRLTEANEGKWEPEDKVPRSFSDRSVAKKTRTLHLQGMIQKMHGLLSEKEEGKFYRWLGFMQGALWMTGVYSLDELRAHNRGKCSGPDVDIAHEVVKRIVVLYKETGYCQLCGEIGESGEHTDDCSMLLLG